MTIMGCNVQGCVFAWVLSLYFSLAADQQLCHLLIVVFSCHVQSCNAIAFFIPEPIGIALIDIDALFEANQNIFSFSLCHKVLKGAKISNYGLTRRVKCLKNVY